MADETYYWFIQPFWYVALFQQQNPGGTYINETDQYQMQVPGGSYMDGG